MLDNQDIHYELYAIRYATNGARLARENFISPWTDPHDAPMPMDFFVWLAVGGGRTILIDSGGDEQTVKRRGHQFVACPFDSLSSLGIDASDIGDVVISHLHWDHAGNFGKAPKAVFHAQPAEIAHATGPCMCQPFMRRPYDPEYICDFVRLLYDGRVAFAVDKTTQIAPGITTHLTSGHTPGLQVVRVKTRRGHVVIASDAFHFYANLERRVPFPVVVDIGQYMAGLDAVLRLADGPDHVIPGHDPDVLSRYPTVEGGRHRNIARLDLEPLIERFVR